jgi:hypothetical protein
VKVDRTTLTGFILEKRDIGADSAELPVDDYKRPIEKLCKQRSDSILSKFKGRLANAGSNNITNFKFNKNIYKRYYELITHKPHKHDIDYTCARLHLCSCTVTKQVGSISSDIHVLARVGRLTIC